MGSTIDDEPADVRLTRRSVLRFGLVAALTGPLVAACGEGGFRPLYGSVGVGANVTEKLATLDVAPIPGRVGQQIRNELIYQSTGGGNPAPPLYRVEIAIRESVTSTLVQVDGDARSQIYNLDANFLLIRLSDKTVVMKGSSFGRAGFERFTAIFATVRARQDAENRAARTVSEDLKSRIAGFLATAA